MWKKNAERTKFPQSEAQENCYLKIWGDPTPRLSPGYGLASLPHGDTTAVFIYEYFWTLGIFRPKVKLGADGESRRTDRHRVWRSNMEPKMEAVFPEGRIGFAQVALFFPRNQGFWIHEIAASIKLLSPPPLDFEEKVGKDLSSVQPLMGLAGGAVAAVGAVGGP